MIYDVITEYVSITCHITSDNCHFVGCQGTSFIAKNCGRVAHHFACIQMTHQIIVVHHFLKV